MAEGLNGNITRGDFFILYALGEELLKRKVNMLGTVRKNKPELLTELLVMKNKEVTSSVFAFTDSHCHLLLPQEREKCPADEHHTQRYCPEHQRRQTTTNGLGLQQDKVRGR